MWYVSTAGNDGLLIDHSDSAGFPPPTVAINDRYIVWTPNHGLGDSAVNEIRFLHLDSLDQPITLLTQPALDANMWFPALFGDELWYGIRFNDWEAATEHARVEMLDLSNPAQPPAIYGEDVDAFMPAVNGEVVVWKGGHR